MPIPISTLPSSSLTPYQSSPQISSRLGEDQQQEGSYTSPDFESIPWSPSFIPQGRSRSIYRRPKNSESNSDLEVGYDSKGEESMTPQPNNETQDQHAGSKRNRFRRGKTLLILGKLVLIRLCCENKMDYKHGNMGKFWGNIRALLKQDHDIDFNSPRQTVERWCETKSHLLAEEEMESGTMHNKDTFWEGVEEFLERMSDVKAEKDDKKQSAKEKLEEAQAIGRVQQRLLAGMDDNDKQYKEFLVSSNSSAMPFKKRRKLDIPAENQMEVALVVVVGMKELMATLGSDLKSMVFSSTEDKDRLKKLEDDNQVLKQKTDAILDMLRIINEKLR